LTKFEGKKMLYGAAAGCSEDERASPTGTGPAGSIKAGLLSFQKLLASRLDYVTAFYVEG